MKYLNASDYTSRARQFMAKHPVQYYVFNQVTFWILANIFLILITYIFHLAVFDSLRMSSNMSIWPLIVIAVISGLLYGSAIGLIEYFFDRQFFKNKPLGRIILVKAILSLIVLIITFTLLRFVLYDAILSIAFMKKTQVLSDQAWLYVFYMVLIYSLVMTLVISFISQVNKKFGPGVLVPLLLGKYRTPREEERIFMFMDLRSSTTIAEALGHFRYSGFIRDSFADINHILSAYNAEIYQYVGDEIVLSWRVPDGLKDLLCVKFFFACERQFGKRSVHYIKNYGFIPEFKASLHMGKVTAVEIGEVKRDIAYHGDTLNTASRIQDKCNEYGQKLMVSEYFLNESRIGDHYEAERLGEILLKGKTAPVGIVGIGDLKTQQAV